ncbi:reticulophagy regulator 3 [Xiphias gladius]|uniref:reticulophagy regulator 3 n=1 Tax=Xiphias gladius TaxID=8245 RepID=UPI001A986CCA|nr:reticulophagy regulator 3 [Xiphias gladius]XP_039974973.1 reticulophagy regulator 3 [Xiphias gladius]XP_039974982.1 reticulophagy regulator 3 [Xiphias gladius]XP_039974991.1 reticulophagy regulator 3 [Xiphias gladius]
MAHTGAMEDSSEEDCSAKQGSSICLRSRPCSTERDGQVRAVKAALQSRLGPYEPVLTYLQSVLVWERPFQCVLFYILVNVVFWFFALTSLRLLFLLASGLAVVVCVDTWRNKIWPEIRVRNPDESENESWGLVQPGILSVPELSHHIAEAWVSGAVLTSTVVQYKRHNPGKFCILTCGLFTCLAVVGRYIPGLVLSYSAVLATLLAPLAAYHRVFPHVYVKLEPVLQRLDFSVRGYMMSKPIDNQFLRRPIHGAASGEASDSEEELAAFCPTFDDAVVAKELALTDSEHSDAEVSYTDNGTFNLSRGQTPLTEGSEDLDRHSDAEESFAQDLPDFPSINPDATLMDDDDDTSIGLPSLCLSGLASHRVSVLDVESHLDSDQDDLDTELSLSGLPPASDFAGDLAGVIASNMIQTAFAAAMQPRPPATKRREGPPKAGASRSYRKQSSSELDTDLEGEDFEMLDQSELNQMDPLGGGGGTRRESQGSNFLSSLLGKPQ